MMLTDWSNLNVVLVAWLSPDRICIPEKVIKMLHVRLVYVGKTFKQICKFWAVNCKRCLQVAVVKSQVSLKSLKASLK